MRYPLALAVTLIALRVGASPLPEYPFVFTVGTAATHVPPDIGRLAFTISAQDTDANAATAKVRETSEKVAGILDAAKIEAADVDASSIDKSSRRHWDERREESVLDGYEVSRRFTVHVRNLDKYPAMVVALLELPNTEGFYSSFERSDAERLRADLLAKAAQDARTRAEGMAAQVGAEVGRVRAVSQVPIADIPHVFGVSLLPSFDVSHSVATDQDRSLDRLLAPATISLSESLNVIYELQ